MSRRHHPALAALVALALLLGVAAPARAELVDIPYVVVRGDTGRRVARRFGLTFAELRALNGDRTLERLRLGEQLVVGRGHRHVHRVHAGESLADIAGRYRVTQAELQRWNRDLRPARLRVGEEILIFSDREEPPSESVGEVDDGSLVHGVALPTHPGFVVRRRERTYMTIDAAERLMSAFDSLRERDADAPRVQIGDASRERGGPLDQHRSHQSGRDVDINYFSRSCREVCGHRTLRPEDLDADRQWRLLEPWIREGAVEYVFIDHALQEPLYEAARRAGATRADLSRWFQWPRAADVRFGLIRHVPRHADHMHVRFVCAEHDPSCVPSDGRDPRHE
jgi:murein endopeptidase